MDEGQGLTFWDFGEILGLCFLCWLIATLMFKLSVRLSHKTSWVKMLAYATLTVSGLGYLLGLPVTVIMWFFWQHEFMKNSKIAATASHIEKNYLEYLQYTKKYRYDSDFDYEVKSKYNAFQYHYCMGSEGNGTYTNKIHDCRGRASEEWSIMTSLNNALEQFENSRLDEDNIAITFFKKKKHRK